MLLQESIEHVSIVSSCNALVHVIYSGVSCQCIHTTVKTCNVDLYYYVKRVL